MSKTTRKRSLKQMDSENVEDEDTNSNNTGVKRSRRLGNLKKQRDEEEKNMFDLEVYEYETIAYIAPKKGSKWLKGSDKIASFDMDHTILKPKGKNKFPKGRKDWVFMYNESLKKNIVPNKLRELHEDGFQIVFISNQNGIGSGKQSLSSVSGKIIDVSEKLKIPIIGLLSIQKDHWRKPSTKMFEYLEQSLNENKKIDYKLSFYCGDAAGRPKQWNGNKKCKKDFSCSDRKFAANNNLPFHTPEAFFLGHNECKSWEWRSMNPQTFIKSNKMVATDVSKWFDGKLPIAKGDKDGLDMVILMGCPGSGKSTFAKKYLVEEGYFRVNRDTLKTQKKCMDKTSEMLKNGTNVVIDNTNPDCISRDRYIKIAKQYKANVRLFKMDLERELAEHLNLYRERLSEGKSKRIPRMAYNIYFKKVRESKEPALDEGISEICKVSFVPDFENEEDKELFMQFS